MSIESVDSFRERAAAWLANNRQHAPRDYGAICPPDLIEEGAAWQRRIFDAGFAGIHWPSEHGGQGLSPAHHGAWVEECAKAGVPPVLNMVGLVLAGGAVMAFGTDEQKSDHLRSTLNAEHVWCQLFSEPGAGSDLGSLSTKAERDGDRFIINGQKVWCSGGVQQLGNSHGSHQCRGTKARGNFFLSHPNESAWYRGAPTSTDDW